MKAFSLLTLAAILMTGLTLSSCGNEAPAEEPQTAVPSEPTVPCTGAVVVTTDSLGTILDAQVKCTGNCADGACKVQVKSDDKGNRRSWCGCEGSSPSECHIVLFEPGTGNPTWFCPTGEGCSVAKEMEMVDGNTVTTYTCSH